MRISCVLLLCTLGLPAVEAVDDTKILAASYALEAAGAYGQAAAVLAVIDDGKDDLLLVRRAWLCHRQGDESGAIALYESAAAHLPGALEPRLGQLTGWVAQGRWPETERTARQVLRLDPGNITGARWLGESLLAQGKTAEAAATADRWAERYPLDATAAELQGRARKAAGDAAGAKFAWRRLQRLDPGNAAAAGGLR